MRRPQIAATVITVIQIPRLTRHDQPADHDAVDLLSALAVRTAGASNPTPQHNRPPAAAIKLMSVPVSASLRRTPGKRSLFLQRREKASGGQ
jgi:hypothetical protein